MLAGVTIALPFATLSGSVLFSSECLSLSSSNSRAAAIALFPLAVALCFRSATICWPAYESLRMRAKYTEPP